MNRSSFSASLRSQRTWEATSARFDDDFLDVTIRKSAGAGTPIYCSLSPPRQERKEGRIQKNVLYRRARKSQKRPYLKLLALIDNVDQKKSTLWP